MTVAKLSAVTHDLGVSEHCFESSRRDAAIGGKWRAAPDLNEHYVYAIAL